MNNYIIYKHTCRSTSKSYIGLTNNLYRRTYYHNRPYSGCFAFARAIQKYGWSDFDTIIIGDNLTLELANLLEAELIIKHDTLSPHGYNLKAGGNVRIVSAETRERISKSNKGKLPWNLDHPHNSATKTKISQSKIGGHHSSETKLKISDSMKGNKNSAVGEDHPRRTLSKSHKEKIRSSRLGQKRPIILATCPHCTKTGNNAAMHRHHFDNCKARNISEESNGLEPCPLTQATSFPN